MDKVINRLKQIVGLIYIAVFISCGNSNTEIKNGDTQKDGSEKDVTQNTKLPVAVSLAAMEKAKTDGKSLFLVIIGTGATGVEKASALANDANSKTKNSLTFSLNRDDVANGDLVSKYGIATVPLPFILVISPKGVAVTGGQPDQLTVEQLVKSVPAPKEDEVLLALSEKKPVFIVVSQKALTDKEGVISVCKAACLKIASNPAIVEIDFDDPLEKAFLNQISVTSINGATKTAVSNPEGQITEVFSKKPSINQLINAANKVIKKSGGCCPGGSGKGCGG
jgi:hypothetical protein